jgi:hypothetical protein
MFNSACSSQSSFCACLLLLCGLTHTATAESPESFSQVSYTNTPISFEVNRGQADARVAFLGHGFFFTPEGVVINLAVADPAKERSRAEERSHLAVRMSFAGPAHPAEVIGEGRLPTRGNYLIGDAANWHTDVPQYARVCYRQVYPGVDIVFYGRGHDLEYDVVVAPGADVKQVRLRFDGTGSLEVDQNGDLALHTRAGDVRQYSPRVYQRVRGSQHRVTGKYVMRAHNEIGFELGLFDRTKPVVVDPVLRWSTLFGGTGDEVMSSIAVDSSGQAYATGRTTSLDFPTTLGAIETAAPAKGTAFITKFARDGRSVIYSTYFGGTNGQTASTGISVDGSGNAYITGYTYSGDLPVTSAAYQTTSNGGKEDFVAKLNATGTSLIYSTYLGGSDVEWSGGIAIDSAGNAYLTGATASPDFPTTSEAFQTSKPTSANLQASFITKLNSDGSSLVYSTYLGGPANPVYPNITQQKGVGIAVDASGNAYVQGTTNSFGFPVTAGAFQKSFGGFGISGPGDAFVTKLNPTGTGLVYSTYLGGNDDEDVFTDGSLAIDGAGNAYITGDSMSANYPTTPGAFMSASQSSCGPILTKLNSTGTALVYSAHWNPGGLCNFSVGNGIAVDSGGHAFIAGVTGAEWPHFPFVRPFQVWIGGPYYEAGESNAFVMKMNAAGTAAQYSSLLGGTGLFDRAMAIALDSASNAYVAGDTNSTDFPVTQSAFRKRNAGGWDAFVAKIIPVCDASLTTPSVTICTPSDRATVHSPVTVTATTRDSTPPVRRTEVWLDYVKVYQVKLSAIYAKIPMTVGTHRLTVRSLDRSGVLVKKTVYVKVAP